MRRRFFIIFHGFMLAGASAIAEQSAPKPGGRDLLLWYEEPAKAFAEALPLGNGRLGAMVFGGTSRERIILNEISLWSGSPQDADRPDAYARLPEIRRLLTEGKNAEAQKLVNENFTCRGPGSGRARGADLQYGSYQVLGNLNISLAPGKGGSETNNAADKVSGYQRALDLSEAVAGVAYESGGIRYLRELFVSAPDQAIVMRMTADRRGAIHLTASLDRPERFEVRASGAHELLMTGRLNNGTDGNGMRYACRLRAITVGGRIFTADNKLNVQAADELLLLFTAATDYRGFAGRNSRDPVQASLDDMERAARKSWKELRRAHVADHQRYFNRVSLTLDDGQAASAAAAGLPTNRRLVALKQGGSDPALMALYFQYGRYLLIGSSRPGGMPANLQGLWAEGIQTPWNGDYHLNINVQMNYWPAEIGNLSELHEPLLKLVASLQTPGARTAKAYYNARGWVAHVISNPWGFTSPGESASWGATVSGAAWLCQHLWEHYAFTRDRNFLSWAYPLMKEAALFYLDLLIEEPKHRWLVTAPSNSPENSYRTPDGFVGQVCMGPTMDQQLLRNLFGNCIRAAEILGIDAAMRRELEEKQARLAPNQVGSEGQLMEWLEEYGEPEVHHRHVSPLWGLYPGDEISVDATPVFARAARALLERRGDAGTGWSLAWKINFWARLGDGDRAHRLLRELLNPTGDMGFDYRGSGSGTYANLFCAHPPFQIDGNFGGSAGIGEMLLQSHGGIIRLMPAVPAAWPSGKVSGLRARGGFTVDIDWSRGMLAQARVVSDFDQPCVVRCGMRSLTVTDPEGHAMKAAQQDGGIRFEARKGKRYTVRLAEQ